MERFSYLNGANPEYIEEIYQRYLSDPNSVDSSWQYFFDGLELGLDSAGQVQKNGFPGLDRRKNGQASAAPPTAHTTAVPMDVSAEAKVTDLIHAYRQKGHLIANVNPLQAPAETHPHLDLSHVGLSAADLDRKFTAAKIIGFQQPATLREIIARLRVTYCSAIGLQFSHIHEPTERDWVIAHFEGDLPKRNFAAPEKLQILRHLVSAETFERFLHTRYVAQKRFSLEGGDALIPALHTFIEYGAELGINNIVMGMAHRGRLNVLTNIFGKKPEYIFTEFEQEYQFDDDMGEGDVKYHMGYSSDVETRSGKSVHLSLANNPSHLAFIHPVVEGIARAKQRLHKDQDRSKVVPLVMHGDAAFAGQGVTYETLNMSQLKGYETGGTVHIIINNQVGFTTNSSDARSTTYATDLARMLETPIFHVNGDDPEAVCYVTRLAVEYRQKFHKDVFIDLICYRKYGHNESDEPSFTQPVMYEIIKKHQSPREIYQGRLITENVTSLEQAQKSIDDLVEQLTQAQKKTREEKPRPFVSAYQSTWKNIRPSKDSDIFIPVDTKVAGKKLQEISEKINNFPGDFSLHSKLQRLFESRRTQMSSGTGIDWGNAELLAYATLLAEGNNVRLSGQDVERGTFTHRHGVVFDSKNGTPYRPLNHIEAGQGEFIIQNSLLSEAGVLGFDYGWSLGDPNALVIWEAQFGDFANGAQVIIDQFISSGESKWQRASGIVLLLPHGYEGQGPEHSSARLERFLQLCGKSNMTVCNLTTPAQLFHAMRRQIKRDFRKPLVIMSPKSLLRHPRVVSNLNDFSDQVFQEVLEDSRFDDPIARKNVKRVLLCSGKIYYDLMAFVDEKKIDNVAVVRLEQLYPWPEERVLSILQSYPKDADLVWVQEEPRNMGAWQFVHCFFSGGYRYMRDKLAGREIRYVGRGTGAAPAVGSYKKHNKEQNEIVSQALDLKRGRE
jgi:2-oxoglutarate dehydrogenase E1 component